MPTLPILCFNDVYRVSQKYVAQPGAPERRKLHPDQAKEDGDGEAKINVAQFGQLLFSHRDEWADRKGDGSDDAKEEKEGLVLFAGDVFNPSVESSVTRGSHMVPVMNALKIDCACIGNHDFDFGFPHLTKLLESTNFPWLLSNIVDQHTGTTPEPLRRFWVTERCGVKIGVIGLVEQDWIATIPSWPEHFSYRDMADTARALSKELRDPKGEHKVDFIIALTHCRVPNDIKLCNELGAVSGEDKSSEHGVDLVIGGHDHMYYIGNGASKSWTGFSGDHTAKGTEDDKVCHLIKSGTDFRDLTSAVLTLSPPSSSSAVRKQTISELTGEHLYVMPSSPASPEITELISKLLSSVSDTLSKPVCFALTPFDARSELVRTKETGLGNWVADVLLHAYAESGIEGGSGFVERAKDDNSGEGGDGDEGGEEEGKTGVKADIRVKNAQGKDHGADVVLLCGGTLRGDSQYGPGKITLGDILEILPFEDPVVCIEIDGKGLWEVLETSLSKWPAQEGRFPIVAGLAVQWDHLLPPNQRIKSIHLIKNPIGDEDADEIEHPGDMVNFVEQEDGTTVEVNQRKVELGEEVKRDGSRVYRVITREYMAQGYDGFEGLKNRKFIVDDENGQIMSSIIRSFLLGSAYIFRHKQLMDAHESHLSSRTDGVLSRARKEHSSPNTSLASSPASTRGGWGGRETQSQGQGQGQGKRTMSMSMTTPRGPESPVRGGMSDSLSSLPSHGNGGGERGWGQVRRHVVKHDWRSIRDALFVGRNEHMSDVDDFNGDKERSRGSAIIPKPLITKTGAVFIKKTSEDELKRLGGELAIVCPLVDGRMRDLSEDK